MTRDNTSDAKSWIKGVLLDFQRLVFVKFISFIDSDKELTEDERAVFIRKVEEFDKKGL